MDTKKYCGDFGTKIEKISEVSGDLQDTIQVMKVSDHTDIIC